MHVPLTSFYSDNSWEQSPRINGVHNEWMSKSGLMNQVSMEYRESGVLPPGVKKYEHSNIDSTLAPYDEYIIYEMRPQRHHIQFTPVMKRDVEENEHLSKIYDLPFPWTQFHIVVIDQPPRTYRIETFITFTNEELKSDNQSVIDFHLPNTLYPGNSVCIYGDALDIENQRGRMEKEHLRSLTISELINLVVSSVFNSGWNLNVTDWPSAIPSCIAKRAEIKKLPDYDRPTSEHTEYYIRFMERWESLSVSDMLSLDSKDNLITMRDYMKDEVLYSSSNEAILTMIDELVL